MTSGIRHSAFDIRHSALLLLGPTGSGKTPLGACFERRGLCGRRCVHFDFGANLRAAAEDGDRFGLGADCVAFVRDVLTSGALLENEHFHVARDILDTFSARHALDPEDWLILNGLPRHVGQAADVDRCVSVRFVLHLACTPDVVYERIRLNTGGDRTERTDDSLAEIARKLALFETRSIPLLDHYRSRSVTIHSFQVGTRTTPDEVADAVESDVCGVLGSQQESE